MILNIDEFYNNKNWKQYVPLEAFQEEMRLVGETFLKDVKVKNVLSITYSIDDYGENPIYIEYLDEKDQKHLVKLKPAIHEELDSVLSKYATIDYVNQKFVEAVQTSKDYTDQAKEALTVLINGSKEEAIQVSKAYTDVEINKLNTSLKEYVDEQDHILWEEITTYANSAVDQAFNTSKEYTDTEINKVKNEITTGNNSVLQQAKDYADQKVNVTLVSSKNYTDTKHSEALTAIETGDTQTLADSNAYTDTKHSEALTAIETGDTQTLADSKAYTDVEINKLNTSLKEYVDEQDHILWQEINTYSNAAVDQAFNTSKEYTDTEINKVKNAITTGNNSVLQQAKDYADQKDNVTLVSSKNYTDTKHSEALTAIETGDTQTLESSKSYTNTLIENYATKTYAEDQNKVYGFNTTNASWEKCDGNFTVTHNDYAITNLGYRQTVDGVEKTVDFTTFATTGTVEALIQEQNATHTKNAPVSLQQKTRTMREVTNKSTLVETKDFYILNLDFSFVPNVLPTSVETNFIENILIDAPEFNGKSFNITFKANEHTATSKGVVGEPLTIKTCAIPVDETIKTVEVVVKEKIIIRKETE